ncbi:MAG: hypothetical protein ABFD49_02965 [Armatimonadota bacterium]|nr:hypothetical protein [bacterium]
MPANLTPDYRAAEARFRAAETTEDKLEALEQMYAAIPKHKGTEKLRADIKRRMAKLRGKIRQAKPALGQPDAYEIIKYGDLRIALIGPHSSGKSTLFALLTSDKEYARQDLISVVRSADAVAIALDCSDDMLLDHLADIREELAVYNILLAGKHTPQTGSAAGTVSKPAFVIANKIDAPGSEENFEALRDVYADEFDILPVSAKTGEGTELLNKVIHEGLTW